jgi:hypothetical protein
MDQFSRLPTDVQNYIKDLYQIPTMSLKVMKEKSSIQLNIMYPHFTCFYRFNPVLDTIPEIKNTDQELIQQVCYHSSVNAYKKIKLFIDELEKNIPTSFDDTYDYFNKNINIVVNNMITITQKHNHQMVLGIENKDALIKVFNEYLLILSDYDETMVERYNFHIM